MYSSSGDPKQSSVVRIRWCIPPAEIQSKAPWFGSGGMFLQRRSEPELLQTQLRGIGSGGMLLQRRSEPEKDAHPATGSPLEEHTTGSPPVCKSCRWKTYHRILPRLFACYLQTVETELRRSCTYTSVPFCTKNDSITAPFASRARIASCTIFLLFLSTTRERMDERFGPEPPPLHGGGGDVHCRRVRALQPPRRSHRHPTPS